MTQTGNHLILSRRALFAWAGVAIGASGRLAASNGDFWEKKAPSEWTAEEIDKLVTKSPWAKEVTAQYVPGERGGDSTSGGGYPGGGGGYPGGSGGGGGYPGGGGGYPGGGGGYPRGGGMGGGGIGLGIPGIGGIGGGGRRRNPQGGQGNASSYRGTVRWESAKPILEATKSTVPDAFANHYVIAVSGIPLLTPRSRRSQTEDDDDRSSRQSGQSSQSADNFDDVKQFSTLQPKGKDYVQAGIVQRQASNGNVLLFGFSRESLPLTFEEKEVDFSTRLGSLLVKAKFNLKEMSYHGQLAV